MGASILPVSLIKNKIYFLFGKERECDENPGWSDFGGGSDNNESFYETALREAGEELTGFLGSKEEIKNLLEKYGTLNIDYKGSNNHGVYRVHIFPFNYNPYLEKYYNSNQKFIQKKLDKNIIKNTKIFEKTEIKWFSLNEMKKNKKKFRVFYQNIVDLIILRKKEIDEFIRKSLKKKNKSKKNKSKKNKSKKNKSKKNRINKK